MNRLTTDNPQNNLMTALNLFYAKDGQAWVRGGGPRPDYPDVTLYDYTRATIWKLLKTRSELAVLTDDDVQQIMDAWLLDGNNSIEGVIATLYTAGWAFAEIRARLAAFEDLEMTPDDIEQTMLRFSSFLMEMTGGRMSKTNYTVQAMVGEANDHFESVCDECFDRTELKRYQDMGLSPEIADETKMMFANEEENQHDKEIFVSNLGWLLSQTRERVERCYLDKEDQVHVVFRGGSERKVNVKHNSYAAIIRDVTKAL